MMQFTCEVMWKTGGSAGEGSLEMVLGEKK